MVCVQCKIYQLGIAWLTKEYDYLCSIAGVRVDNSPYQAMPRLY
jgi:hypothetical protein